MGRYNILKWSVYTLCILVLAILQMQLPAYPRIMDITPLFLIPAVISIAMVEGETAGGIYGIVAGLFWDCATGRIFGFNALFLMIIGVAVGLFIKFLIRNITVSGFLFTFVFTFTHELITWFFFYYMEGNRDFIYTILHIILPTAVITVVFAVPIYLLIRMINRRLTSDDSDLTQ